MKKLLAQNLLEKINYKEARKRAEKKGDKTNLERYGKLKEIIDSCD